MNIFTVKFQNPNELKNLDYKRIFSTLFSHGMRIFGEKSVKKWLKIGIFFLTAFHGKIRKIEG